MANIKNGRKAFCFVTILLCCCPFWGCNNRMSSSREVSSLRKEVSRIQKGMTKEELQDILNSKGQHQFTAVIEGDHFHCISYSFVKYYINYYFTFKNEKLFSIIEFPNFEYDLVPYMGTSKAKVRKPWTPEDRIKKALESENLIGEAFVRTLEKEVSEYLKKPVTYNVLPALIITAPLYIKDAPNRRKEEELNAQLIEKYNPEKINIGMTDQEVNDALGEPHYIRALIPGKVLHVYGEEASLNRLATEKLFSWIAVFFEDGKATRIFSHDFFHKELFGNNPPADKTSTQN